MSNQYILAIFQITFSHKRNLHRLVWTITLRIKQTILCKIRLKKTNSSCNARIKRNFNQLTCKDDGKMNAVGIYPLASQNTYRILRTKEGNHPKLMMMVGMLQSQNEVDSIEILGDSRVRCKKEKNQQLGTIHQKRDE